MHAAFSDPQGPRAWRVAPYVVPLLLFLFAVFGPVDGAPAGFTGVFAVTLFNLLGLVGLRQRRSRQARLECGPGYVDVKNAGSRNQRIHARSIVGATTARTKDGVLLTLQHKDRDQPVSLEVANDGEAEKVRHALGIGHGGFGTLEWRTQHDQTKKAGFVGRILAVIAGMLILALGLGASVEAAIAAGVVIGQVGVIGAIIGLVGLLGKRSDPSVVMAAEGLRLRTPRGWFTVPYHAVLRAEDHKRGLVFHVPPPYGTVGVEVNGPATGGLSERDRAIVMAQITAAAQRARGLGPQKQDVTGRLDTLRRNGESARDWLVRLDMAGQMLSTAPGYRGNTLDADDLWAILEDPEAEAELRAAAARVLRHAPQPNVRARIDAALAAVRDEGVSKRLRVAIRDDLDGASQELAFLDATEPQAMRQELYVR